MTLSREVKKAEIPYQGLMVEKPRGECCSARSFSKRFSGVCISTGPTSLLAHKDANIRAGFPLSFGVFQRYYTELPQFANNPYVSVVGSVATGIGYLGAPIMTTIMNRFPHHLGRMIWVGCRFCIRSDFYWHLMYLTGTISIGSLVIGSFTSTLAGLILTQGVMYGFGFLIVYYPVLSMINEYWVVRRGMAYGLLCSATGVSGVVMPFVTKALLDRYGYQTTLRAVAIALAVLTAPLLPFIKGRLPAGIEHADRLHRSDWSFLRAPLFWVFTACNLFQGMGYFFPSLYLPSFAARLGLGTTQGALVLALVSIAQVFGQFSFGWLSDRHFSVGTLLMTSTVISSIAVLALWGLSKSLAPLCVFSLIYGFFGAGYVALWARMVTAVSKEPRASMAMFGTFCFQKGVGNVLSGPIGAGLLSQATGSGRSGYGLGEYRSVIIFAGTTLLASAMGAALSHFRARV